MRPMSRSACERGSGSVLGVAIIGATMLLTALVVPLYAALASGQAVQNAADAAALAAADTASGALAGSPCVVAAEAATLNGASLLSCSIDGVIATVSVGDTVMGLQIDSSARAGPPGG